MAKLGWLPVWFIRGATTWEWKVGRLYGGVRFPRFWRARGVFYGPIIEERDEIPPCPICGAAPVVTRNRLACWAQILCKDHACASGQSFLGGPPAMELAVDSWWTLVRKIKEPNDG